MKRSVIIIRQGLVRHRLKDRGITERCECGANVLSHETHRAEVIAKLLADEGLING